MKKSDLQRIKTFGGRVRREPKDDIGRQIERVLHSFRKEDEDTQLLDACRNDWEQMEAMREEHRRNQRYKNGDQWGDLMRDPDDPSRLITEREYISRSGRTATSHNLIQTTVRNIEGQMLSNPSKPTVVARAEADIPLGEMLTNAVQKSLELNDFDTHKISVVESMLSAGLGVGKVRYAYWYQKNRTDVKVDFININRFFFNQDCESPTLDDIYRVGEIHDLTWNELLRDFYTGKGSADELRELYARVREMGPQVNDKAAENISTLDFYGAANNGKYRVIEVWHKCMRVVTYVHDKARGEEFFDEQHDEQYWRKENERREAQMRAFGIPEEIITERLVSYKRIAEEYWEARWLTPSGYCLKKMETPYEHQSHPYVIITMPRVDGVVQPILSGLNEINRTINRHLTMIDFAIGSSAKGTLFVPRSVLGGMTEEEFAHAYTKTDSVIFYDDTQRGGVSKPYSETSAPIPVGAFDFLHTEMNMLKEVSGLSGAMQGQVAQSGTPASLYAQQAQNSMLNFVVLFDRMKKYSEYMCEKILRVQMQYYTTRRLVNISGQSYNAAAAYYEPQMVEKILDWNIVIADSTDTPVYRQINEDFLRYLFESQAISVEMMLENSSIPFAQKLLAQLRSARDQMESGQATAASAELAGAKGLIPQGSPAAQAAVMQALTSPQQLSMRQAG